MNARLQAFQDFLATQSIQIPLWGFLLNMVLAAVSAYVLSRFYIVYGTSLSNRKVFAHNFVLLALTTTLVITIVKSSLALSLGLVGALSIVRFRAAIKEPEELTYLFLTIAIGLGFGAGQRLITVTAIAFVLLLIWGKHRMHRETDTNLFLIISAGQSAEKGFDVILQVLKKHCRTINLRRLDETHAGIEASFIVEFDTYDQFNVCRQALRQLDDSVKVSFFDNKGMFA